jgi:hypothetical protein
MPDPIARRSLPPMSAVEFAIENTFRHFFFGLRLAILWAIILVPFLAACWYAAFRNGMPDFRALPPQAMAALGVTGAVALLATFSIAVHWHRRLVLGATPRRFGWVSLGGKVWRYLFAVLFILVVLAVYGGIGAGIMLKGVPALEPQLGPAAKPLGIALTVLFGLSALFTWYRLSTLLPAIAVADKDYSLGTAWRSSRNNRIAFLAFTFWFLFSLAVAGALGAGAFFGQKALNNPYVTAAAFGLIGLLVWLALFMVTSVAAAHYMYFSGKREVEKAGD